jgi:hypothetical protein
VLYGYNDRGAVWELAQPFRFHHPEFPRIRVPAGSLTDGASIPRIFHAILGPSGPWFPAAVVHDYLYSTASSANHPDVSRKLADQIFLQAMDDCGVGGITRTVIYYAVRAFGWLSWRNKRNSTIEP